MPTALEYLKKVSTIVADTGDFKKLKDLDPTDGTTNPSLLLACAQMPEYNHLLEDAINYGKTKKNAFLSDDDLLTAICDRLIINFGKEILNIIPGVVSTEINAEYSFDTEASIKKAHKFIEMYKEIGVPKERILIKLATTWEGIKAAEILEKEGIKCNMTLMFSLAQAIAAGDAKVHLISPFVGRILDWYKNKYPNQDFNHDKDPGVQFVTSIYNYYKKYSYKTIIMAASFRNIDEILNLAGCPKLTISPTLLNELNEKQNYPQIIPNLNKENVIDKIEMTESKFRWMMNQDAMATEKLSEGIRNFYTDGQKLREFIKLKL